jgi:hypothetical protein
MLSELVERGCEFVIVKSISLRYRSFTASDKLLIIEEVKTEINLLEENLMSAKVAYVFEKEMNNFFFFLKNGVHGLLE